MVSLRFLRRHFCGFSENHSFKNIFNSWPMIGLSIQYVIRYCTSIDIENCGSAKQRNPQKVGIQ